MLLILVLFLQRTLQCIVAHLATSVAVHVGDILLSSLFPLLPLGCKGCVILFLHFGLRPIAAAAPVKFYLEQVSPQLFLFQSCPHLIPIWQCFPTKHTLDKDLPIIRDEI